MNTQKELSKLVEVFVFAILFAPCNKCPAFKFCRPNGEDFSVEGHVCRDTIIAWAEHMAQDEVFQKTITNHKRYLRRREEGDKYVY